MCYHFPLVSGSSGNFRCLMLRKGKLCEMLALHQHEDPPYLEATRLTVTGRLPPVCMCVFNQLNDFFEEDQAYNQNEIVRVCAPGATRGAGPT